jgi:uncharacterized protein
MTDRSHLFRVLSLDGGGAKGFYTLGVLREIEAMIGCSLHECFDLVFGTSTGAIIGSLVSIGLRVEQIYELYRIYVPEIMQCGTPTEKSRALGNLAHKVFGDRTFDAVKTNIGVVATRWVTERPMIFKGSVDQAHGRVGTFVPGFGCTLAEAVEASCSAYPFFNRKMVKTSTGDEVELIDGGYCANNPTLYAIADAVAALNIPRERLRIISVGVGVYPSPKPPPLSAMWFAKRLRSVQLLQKTLEINTQSMDQLRSVLFGDVQTIRISDTFERPEMATDLFEHNAQKLNLLHQRGRESFGSREKQLHEFLL